MLLLEELSFQRCCKPVFHEIWQKKPNIKQMVANKRLKRPLPTLCQNQAFKTRLKTVASFCHIDGQPVVHTVANCRFCAKNGKPPRLGNLGVQRPEGFANLV
ncbi:MAG: hypothetical protein MJY78_03090 [Fibrobacter sp.]|nr:hypothetical protein [Fibrobacter sp.]